MHTYLLGREKNQSIRSSADTHTNTNKAHAGKHGARMPITGLMSASEPKQTQQISRESGTQPTTVKHTQTDRQQMLRSTGTRA